jgi:hypothetical protein
MKGLGDIRGGHHGPGCDPRLDPGASHLGRRRGTHASLRRACLPQTLPRLATGSGTRRRREAAIQGRCRGVASRMLAEHGPEAAAAVSTRSHPPLERDAA